MPPIEVAAAANGTLTYLIHAPPSALPAVLRRDLLGAWDAARAAALESRGAGRKRAFRFARPDGGITDLSLSDPDAQCWANAVDSHLNIASPYGLSVCLRLLALIDLLAAAPWARAHVDLRPNGANLHPGLLRLAAEARLTDEAGFDQTMFRAGLAPDLASPTPTSPTPTLPTPTRASASSASGAESHARVETGRHCLDLRQAGNDGAHTGPPSGQGAPSA